MNYIVISKRGGVLTPLFFTYRDESDVVYNDDALIRNEDDVIRVMMRYFKPDNGLMIIRETLLDIDALTDDLSIITEQLKKYLDEERIIS
jgi:hypothetical protein